MFERPTGGERALLVHVNFSRFSCAEELAELNELALSAGAQVIDVLSFTKDKPEAKYFIGKGQAQIVHDAVCANAIDVVIVNHNLSPAQERNLEKLWQCQVLNRIGLILAIFAKRARTHEGKLQVELAQLAHLSTRLVRGWTHLERQKGGIGLRGPGETQLETDRRLLAKRMATIRERLEKVRAAREQNRRKRQKHHVPTVSFVGYTNAGKSTLFNRLTQAEVYVADQLFATLDPTLRQISIEKLGDIVLADTVGFIRDLPHELIAAFKATLEETQEADLLVHVIDMHDPAHVVHSEHVNLVLAEIGASDVPQLLVYNKIDLLEDYQPKLERDEAGLAQVVWLSAVTGQGLDLLHAAIFERLSQAYIYKTIVLSPAQAGWRAKLYARNVVHEERVDEQGNCTLVVALPRWEFEKLASLLAESTKVC